MLEKSGGERTNLVVLDRARSLESSRLAEVALSNAFAADDETASSYGDGGREDTSESTGERLQVGEERTVREGRAGCELIV